MSQQRIKIPRVSDRAIAATFRDLGEVYGVESANVTALGFTNLGDVNLLTQTDDVWVGLLAHDSYLIDNISFSIGGLSISYHRGGSYQPQEKSPIFDEILLSERNSSTSMKDRLSIVAFLNNRLRAFEPDRVISGAPSNESAQLLAIHQSTLERLEHLNEDLIRKSSDFRVGLENKYEEKLTSSQNELLKKRGELEQESRARAIELDERERSIQEKLKAIDDRDNTHARREIRDRMLDDVKQRISQFGVSKATGDKRLPVKLGIWFLCAIIISLIIWTAFEIYSMNRQYFSMLEGVRNISSLGVNEMKAAGLSVELIAKVSALDVDRSYLYWLWARLSVFSMGLIGTLIYYIKWQNQWAEQHTNAEFQLQQFYIDVNRANWVLESCLEWRKETGSVIPRTLIHSITNGLFSNMQSEPERAIHPADELASALMGSASKLKLKLGDNELEFDKPQKIKNKLPDEQK